MKKILFPTDFSDVANNAFVYALRLADRIGAEIITLHVYDLPQVDYINAPVYLLDVYEVTELSNFENYKHHIPVLRKIAEENKLDHVVIKNVLESGNLIDSIHRISESEEIDYIVMGTKGAEGLETTLFGTVTDKVMHHSHKVVLGIPGNCKYADVKNILFITKYKPEDHAFLEKVIELATISNSHINCLYVVADEKMDQRVVDKWRQGITYGAISYHSVPSQDIEGKILEFIDSQNIDMLAMPLHQRGFFEGLFHASLSKKLTFHVQIPILAMRE